MPPYRNNTILIEFSDRAVIQSQEDTPAVSFYDENIIRQNPAFF